MRKLVSKQLKKCVAVVFAVMMCANVFAYKFQVGGIYYNINSETTTVEVTSNNNSYSGSVVIPSTVTYNSITYNVTSIGDSAFYRCASLTSVTIPNSVTSIGESAFEDCTSLTSITIPNSVTSIGGSAFFGCTELTSITIPNSVTSIDDCAFYNCTGLTSVTIGNGVTSIGWSAFRECTSLTSITIGNSVTSIDDYAFYRCTSLTSVTISNSVTSIGGSVFEDCTSLTSITIGNSVTTIGWFAFDNCTALSTIDCKAENPPVLYTGAFEVINEDNVTVTVPCEKSSLYQNAIGWSLFNNIIENCEVSINVVEENQILVYPNPAKDNITLEADEDIFIFNNLGQIVKQVNNPKGKITISVADLPKGTYYLKISENKQKLVKSN